MNKTDSIVESIVRKIEKTTDELAIHTGKKTELTVGGGKCHPTQTLTAIL